MKTVPLMSFLKRAIKLLCLPVFLIALFSSCQKDVATPDENAEFPTPSFVQIGSCYDLTLVNGAPVDNGNGTYTWTWTFTNTNPGNGNNGTCQNLSHWDFIPGSCLEIDDIVSAAYSSDGTNYTSFVPNFATDPSLNTCSPNPYSGEVFKFDFGTSGVTPSYYQLVVNKNFAVDANSTMIYKSGTNTGCGIGAFEGIGCEIPPQCFDGETAWGAGTRFVKQGNWATYFSMTVSSAPSSITVELLAGQTIHAGSVTVNHDGLGNYSATYNTDSPWVLSELHFKYYGTTKPPAQNPAPGLFPFKADFDVPYPTTHTFYFTGVTSGKIYLAAHAVVLQPADCP
jgi:hypothetical protein